MSTKSIAKTKLAQLLDDFERMNRNGILHGQTEATARTWVEKFLTIFGWNASDPHQVRQEYRIKGRAARRLKSEGTTHRRPDYCLISNERRILYIDVKKFEADILNDSGIAYQIRCYGWSESFLVSYAFDLEELAVYDCRIRPDGADEADIARVRHLRYTDYLDHFDWLWDYFSKEAIDSGSLSRRLPDDQRPKGSKTIDQDFEEKLSSWRKGLAKSILRYGKERDAGRISAAAQRILDRIIFLRICEEYGYEEKGTLLEMGQNADGFWPLFLEEHDQRYCRIYDGILFPASGEDDPTGVDVLLRSWWLKGRIFREITDSLYYPNPYRFDVVPIELLGGIYERYLGKRLRILGNDVDDEFKPEYQRTKGAVYTPPWVVRRVIRNAIGPLTKDKNPDEILGLRILDPACGSAGFLLGAYDFIEESILTWFEKNPGDKKKGKYTIDTEEGPRLIPSVAREILNGCVYGVDIDPEAVEVARMSLALRYLDRTAGLDGEPHHLLNGIGRNIRQGNSLVGPDIVGLGLDPGEIIEKTMPFDWANPKTGFGDVAKAGGFDAVVGNPPYIEVKRYREWMPLQYQYLKESGIYETTAQGKTDLAMPFMERGMKLLREGGRLGFIIQNRFFKTDYGEIVRAWLHRNKAIAEIEDFRDLQVFSGRTTYTAIVQLQKNSPSLRYRTFATIDDAIAGVPCVESRMKWGDIDAGVWSFDQPHLLEVHKDLARRHGTIGSRADIHISVGLQTLYGKIYQFDPVEVKSRTVIGVNGDGETITLEKSALRPLCRNRGFYPFRANNADAWVIFPYEIIDGQSHEILWPDFKVRFPRAAFYLEERKIKITKAVEVESEVNRWHLYTRPQNLISQTRPKVLFPMTIEDTVASIDYIGDIYQDNVNINSISINGAAPERLNAIGALMNSSVFNALARLKAGLNEAGWRKFNRQYAELVPFPSAIIDDHATVNRMSRLAEDITKVQMKSLKARSEGSRSGFRAALDVLWKKLDDEVESIYGLSNDQKKVIKKYPRRIDRFDLLNRQTAVPEDE
jgi:hypothetical protein